MPGGQQGRSIKGQCNTTCLYMKNCANGRSRFIFSIYLVQGHFAYIKEAINAHNLLFIHQSNKAKSHLCKHTHSFQSFKSTMLFTSTLAKIAAIVAISSQVAFAAPTSAKPNVKQQALTAHNKYRQKHHVGNIKWSQKLANHAQTVSDSCIWGHNVVSS